MIAAGFERECSEQSVESDGIGIFRVEDAGEVELGAGGQVEVEGTCAGSEEDVEPSKEQPVTRRADSDRSLNPSQDDQVSDGDEEGEEGEDAGRDPAEDNPHRKSACRAVHGARNNAKEVSRRTERPKPQSDNEEEEEEKTVLITLTPRASTGSSAEPLEVASSSRSSSMMSSEGEQTPECTFSQEKAAKPNSQTANDGSKAAAESAVAKAWQDPRRRMTSEDAPTTQRESSVPAPRPCCTVS